MSYREYLRFFGVWFDDEELFLLLNGGLNRPIVIGEAKWEIVQAIGAMTTDVYLSPYSAQKIKFKHNMQHRHFAMVQMALLHGTIYKDRDRHLVCLYDDVEIFGKTFKTVIKAIHTTPEIYLETFHRLESRRQGQMLKKAHKRGQVLQEQKW